MSSFEEAIEKAVRVAVKRADANADTKVAGAKTYTDNKTASLILNWFQFTLCREHRRN